MITGEELSGLGAAERPGRLLRPVLDLAGVTNRVPLQGVVAGCQAAHARQDGADRLRRRCAVLLADGGEVPVERPCRQLPHPQLTERRDDLMVEAVAVLSERRGRAVAVLHRLEPRLG